jgi:pilus assembly protein CpaF
MSRTLRDRLTGRSGPPASDVAATAVRGVRTDAAASGMFGWRRGEGSDLSPVEELKRAIHRQLIERLDLEALEALDDEAQLTLRIRQAVADLLRGETTPLSQAERETLVEQVVYEVIGLGPIEPFFRDRTVSDILINGPRDIYVERGGRLERVNEGFRDNAHLLAVIDRIVSRVGRRIDESSPMVDARLPDGSRVNAIIAPLAVDAPVLSIRRFGAGLGADQLVDRGAMTADMQRFLRACVRARLNILVSGGTGSGKTTLLNALSSFIPGSERVITIEDAAELRLQQEHVVRLETRPPNAEGKGEVTMRDLVKNALRMRPDRIIIGEVRAGEALDMLQAMNTGHEGSLTTVHANTPRDAIGRLETMVRFAGADLPDRAVREQVSSAIDLVVQASRLADGSRRVVSICEVAELTSEGIAVRELFRFRRDGVRADGTVDGAFEACGITPRFLDRLAVAGVPVPASLFVEGAAPTSEAA